MLKWDPDYEVWVFIEWSSRRLYVELYDRETAKGIFWKLYEEGTALSCETQTLEENRRPRLPLYCVTWAKQLLGVEDWRIITPYQLKCELLRRGASVMFQDAAQEIV